jgi:hypothetical protein
MDPQVVRDREARALHKCSGMNRQRNRSSKPEHEALRNRQRKVSRKGATDREGASETQVGDRTGPGPGYDKEPVQERDKGGVTPG